MLHVRFRSTIRRTTQSLKTVSQYLPNPNPLKRVFQWQGLIKDTCKVHYGKWLLHCFWKSGYLSHCLFKSDPFCLTNFVWQFTVWRFGHCGHVACVLINNAPHTFFFFFFWSVSCVPQNLMMQCQITGVPLLNDHSQDKLEASSTEITSACNLFESDFSFWRWHL